MNSEVRIPVKLFDPIDHNTEFLSELKGQIDHELQIRLVSIVTKCLIQRSKTEALTTGQFFYNLTDEELYFIRDSDCQFSGFAQLEIHSRLEHYRKYGVSVEEKRGLNEINIK